MARLVGAVVALVVGLPSLARAWQERKPEPPSAAVPLVVEVVDGAGKPCADVPVSIVLCRGMADGPAAKLFKDDDKRRLAHERSSDFLSEWSPPKSSGADGRVTFDLAQLQVAPQPFEALAVRLALPLLDPLQAKFDPKKPPSAPLRLVRPDCGSVRIELPGIAQGSVRVRGWDAEEPERIWSSSAPDACAIVDGVARVPLAVVGLDLEYEATWEGLGTPLVGHFHGPTRSGEEMRFAPPTIGSYPRLTGRILDDDSNPVAHRALHLLANLTDKERRWSARGDVTTDGGGRFDFPLVADHSPTERGELHVSPAAAKEGERDLGQADAIVAFTKVVAGAPNDVGDVVLVSPGSLRWLGRLKDDELQKTYETRKATEGTRRVDVEACLVEMGRRKGERWKKYLASELAAVRPKAEKPKKPAKGKKADDEPERGEAAEDLELLTALRRAQGKPDPLAVNVGEGPFDAIFPATPSIAFSLKNVDSAKESFGLTRGGSYRSGRFARAHVEATGPDGARVPVKTQFGMGMGGGMFQRGSLAFGEIESHEIKLDDFLSFPGPGIYQVRICYHDQVDIAGEERVDGFVVATSPEFMVRLKSRPIEVKRADVDALKAAFLAIDFTKKVPLTAGHWWPDLVFQGAAVTPEDRFFRAGYGCLPALFELLDDANLTIEQRSWVFALLWDVTGLHNPTGGEFNAAVKDPVWLTDWPGSSLKTHPNFGEFGEISGGGWPDHQKGLTARWKATRSWFDVKIVK